VKNSLKLSKKVKKGENTEKYLTKKKTYVSFLVDYRLMIEQNQRNIFVFVEKNH